MGTSVSGLPVRRVLSISLWLVFCVALLTLVSVSAFFWAPATEDYSITERYLVTSTGDDARVYLGVLLPTSGPYQEVKPARIYWQGSINRVHERDVDVIKLSGEVPGNSSQEAVIEYDVSLLRARTSWEAPIEVFQLEPQYNIESDHPTLVEAASTLASGNSRQDAYEIYAFTSRNLSRPEKERQFIDASALLAYRTQEGSCGEFANLMVALCRASGIPAQTIIGILVPELPPYSTAEVRTLEHPGESHAWVEVYTGSHWEMVDPSRQSHALIDQAFGWNDGRHLSYGEVRQLTEVYAATRDWALSRGFLVATRFASLKFVAAADPIDVLVTPRVIMKKGWDGRWFNMLISWLVTLVILYWINRKKVATFYPTPVIPLRPSPVARNWSAA